MVLRQPADANAVHEKLKQQQHKPNHEYHEPCAVWCIKRSLIAKALSGIRFRRGIEKLANERKLTKKHRMK